jgi:CspA family cold shock protein
MATGTVKWFSDDKGYGFITPDERGRDLFVHHTAVFANGYRSLTDRARVSYHTEAAPKGPQGVNIGQL